MLEHRLSASERPRDESSAAFRYRIERVYATHASLHDFLRPRLLPIGFDGDLHRPFLSHGDIYVIALLVCQHCHDIIYGVLAFRNHGLDSIFSFECERHHDFVRQPPFFHFSQPVCGDNFVARVGERGEIPELLVIERVGIFSSLQEYALHCLQIVLEPVIHA